MRVRSVEANNRKRQFQVGIGSSTLPFPYARLQPPPAAHDLVARVEVDAELGGEGFSFELRSGVSGTVHAEQVLEYNRDPGYLRERVLYQLTLEAQRRIARTALSMREIIRRLGTSPPQLYRLLSQTNYRKSVDQMLRLLAVLECEVELAVRDKTA